MTRDEVDELIREARAEARAAVKARLRERFEDAMAREVEARLEPPPAAAVGAVEERAPAPPPAAPVAPIAPARAEAGEALWVYCVAGEDFPGLEGGVAGVAPGRPPRVVRAAGASAVVSEVPLAEFGEDALKRNLNDLDWLEAVARGHEAVLDAALGRGDVVPMRVCTIFRGDDDVRRMLTDRRAELAEALEQLHGRSEWGVKIIADRARVAEIARTRGGSASAERPTGEGGAYLGKKQADRYLRELVDVILDDAVRESHARLEEWAAASELLPSQRRELAGYEGEMVFNGAYLVDDEREDAFRAVVDELRRQYSDAALTFELTGPWPAFHFVGPVESVQEGVA